MDWREELQAHIKTLPPEIQEYVETVWSDIVLAYTPFHGLVGRVRHTDLKLLECILRADDKSLAYVFAGQLYFLKGHYESIVGSEKCNELRVQQGKLEKEQGLSRNPSNQSYRKQSDTIYFNLLKETFKQACNQDNKIIDRYIKQLRNIPKGEKKGKARSWQIYSALKRELYRLLFPLYYSPKSPHIFLPNKLLDIIAEIISTEVHVEVEPRHVKSCIQETKKNNPVFILEIQKHAKSLYENPGSALKKQETSTGKPLTEDKKSSKPLDNKNRRKDK